MVMLFAFYDFLVVMYYIYISPFFVNLAKGIRKKPIKKNLKKKKILKKKKEKKRKEDMCYETDYYLQDMNLIVIYSKMLIKLIERDEFNHLIYILTVNIFFENI